jgi:SAM-dependent methyltransferase
MAETQAKEAQNQIQFDNYGGSRVHLGPYTQHMWNTDPRHLGFLLSRYKFVAKMFEGKNRVLEIGVGDAFGTPVVLQTVGSVHCLDWEPLLIDDNKSRTKGNVTFECLDITKDKPKSTFDAAFSLDVIEHIPNDIDKHYFKNIAESLTSTGVFICGTPNVTSSQYASEASLEGHINLKSSAQLKQDMEAVFENVFMFSMNDEIVHTGYAPMAHYIFAMGVGVKR